MTDDELREFVRQVMRQSPVPTQAGIRAGDGDPTGVVDAPIGTLYRNRLGGAGTTLYVNETGGVGGWVAK
jgi:hypothetical protein